MSDFNHAKYDYQAVQGDKQEISETLEHPDGTSPDLNGRSVTAIVRHVVSDTKVVDAAATIDDAAAGSVSYVLSTAETGREGLHHVEFEATGGSTDPTTFPVEEPLALHVRASVEGGDGVAELEEDATVDTLEANAVGTAADPVAEAYHETADIKELSVGKAETDTSVVVTEDDTITYGRDHGATVQGDNVVVGNGARALADSNGTVSGNDPRRVAVGFEAARNDEQFGVTAAGYRAAGNNTGNNVTAAGYEAAQSNTGDRVTAAGYRAAGNNTGNNVTAAGFLAARDNTGGRVTAAGFLAARDNTGDRVTAAGYAAARGDGLSDPSTMGNDNIGIGASAIRNNQASGLIAIGQAAGVDAQTDDQLIITQRDGTRRMVMDLTTGDVSITGSLTENATIN
jgi:hypothetical protein